MRRWIRRHIPSMFHRRLTLLGAVVVVSLLILLLQTARLTLVQGPARRKQAQSALSEREFIPTARGRILDRTGRVLAVDDPSYDVSVSYDVISGRWSRAQAQRDAYQANRNRWGELDDDEKEQRIVERQKAYAEQIEMLWSVLCDLGQTSRTQIDQRIQEINARVNGAISNRAVRRQQQLEEERETPVTFSDAVQRVLEETIAHPVAYDIDEPARAQVESFITEARREALPREATDAQGAREGGAAPADNASLRVWREVKVTPSKRRRYPEETIALHIEQASLPAPLRKDSPIDVEVHGVGLHFLGRLRNVWKPDLDRKPFQRTDERGRRIIDLYGYRDDDRIGAGGIEESMEEVLRGRRGQVVRYLDTGSQDRIEPVRGKDVTLTIDARLQARIMALMDPRLGLMKRQEWHGSDFGPVGEPLCGAAVVLDVESGEVLAAVSVPWFSLDDLENHSEKLFADQVNKPYVFRPVGSALGGVYQPGSTIKPLILVAAESERKLGRGEAITCNGHLEADDPAHYRCWIFKTYNNTHGPLQAPEAIARSCNIFFYTLGRRLGGKRLVTWFDKFNLGRPTGCGLPEEAGGDIPDLSKADQRNAPGFSLADATFMAIGQGPVRWTPLQAANVYATLARGGVALTPTFIHRPEQKGPTRTDLHLDPHGVHDAIDGLYDAVNQSYGTGNHLTHEDHTRENIFNLDNVRVMGKSGTADAEPLRIDSNGNGKIDSSDDIIKNGDHAWFVGMVQKPGSKRPDYVVAVVVEYAGSGGKIAGPIANQILHALRAEGYL
jgi:penicillin-binding protein 2